MCHTFLSEPISQPLQRFPSSWQLCPSLRWPMLELEHCLDSQAGLSGYFLSSLGPKIRFPVRALGFDVNIQECEKAKAIMQST